MINVANCKSSLTCSLKISDLTFKISASIFSSACSRDQSAMECSICLQAAHTSALHFPGRTCVPGHYYRDWRLSSSMQLSVSGQNVLAVIYVHVTDRPTAWPLERKAQNKEVMRRLRIWVWCWHEKKGITNIPSEKAPIIFLVISDSNLS